MGEIIHFRRSGLYKQHRASLPLSQTHVCSFVFMRNFRGKVPVPPPSRFDRSACQNQFRKIFKGQFWGKKDLEPILISPLGAGADVRPANPRPGRGVTSWCHSAERSAFLLLGLAHWGSWGQSGRVPGFAGEPCSHGTPSSAWVVAWRPCGLCPPNRRSRSPCGCPAEFWWAGRQAGKAHNYRKAAAGVCRQASRSPGRWPPDKGGPRSLDSGCRKPSGWGRGGYVTRTPRPLRK